MPGGVEEPTLQAVLNALNAEEVFVEPDAEALLSALVNGAQAKQLVELPDVPVTSEQALVGLNRLVDRMVKLARRSAPERAGNPTVSPDVVDQSLRGLCPLPPWC
jgi:hypothetical protein